MKDYYAILGISVNAEDEVITASYKALVKKYHPDIFKGSKKQANDRIREINEAYEELSNKSKKAEYDAEFAKDETGSFDDFEKSEFNESNIHDDDWKTLIDVFPEAEKFRKELVKISSKIGLNYQITLLTKKLGNKAEIIADEIKHDFLKRYFGNSNKIHEIALQAILSNELTLAKELNKKISLLGDGASDKIYSDLKYKITEAISKKKYKKEAQEQEKWGKKQRQKAKTHYQWDSNKQPENHSQSLKIKEIPATLILIFIIIGILGIVFLSFSDNSETIPILSEKDRRTKCLYIPSECSDEMLCKLATRKSGIVWADDSVYYKKHVDFAKYKDLKCTN